MTVRFLSSTRLYFQRSERLLVQLRRLVDFSGLGANSCQLVSSDLEVAAVSGIIGMLGNQRTADRKGFFAIFGLFRHEFV